MKNNRFKRLLKLNALLTAAIIVSDVLIIHPHTTDNHETARQVAVPFQMRQKSSTQLKSIQADEEQEFSD